MHPYSTSCEKRNVIIGFLGAISVPLALALSQILESTGFNKYWFIDYPSVLGIFGALFALFNLWLWHIGRWTGLVTTPYLSGNWDVEGQSSFDNLQKTWTGVLRVKQTWSRITFELETATSRSKSISASIFPTSTGVDISYEYLNEPNAKAGNGLHAHRGVVRLRMIDTNSWEGEYFSGRDRKEYGAMQISRQLNLKV